jgi:hypothetical protein
MKTNLFFPIKTRKFILRGTIIAGFLFAATLSCNNYQNPGNNTGKTGDGTTRDSLKAPKSDTGKGGNLLNKEIKNQNDSLKK